MTRRKECAFAECGKPAHKDRRLCEEHLKQQRHKMARYRANRKQLMLCSRCPNPARKLPNGTASTLCEVCRAHVRALEARHAARH